MRDNLVEAQTGLVSRDIYSDEGIYHEGRVHGMILSPARA
jgi:hypothetical protein